MKVNKKHKIIILITFISLILLILIQFRQIIESAKLEQKLFANKVELALISAKKEIAENMEFCTKMEKCFEQNSNSCKNKMEQNDWYLADSIVTAKLQEFNISIDYDFDIIDSKNKSVLIENDCYIQSLEEIVELNGVQMKIHFPSRNEFISKQMTAVFISSILLIILISFSFIVMLKLFNREKKISENTRDFINNMTHEFKTPLANIGLANNLIRKKIDSENLKIIQKYTEIITSEKTKLTENIEQILNVALLEQNSNLNIGENILISDVLEQSIENIKYAVNEKNGKIEVKINSDRNLILGNKFHLLNVFTNILDNACKYTARNPEIEITTRNDNNNIIITISDNGIGISKENQKQIFDKFFRVSTGDVHNIKGFGLGLSYAKAVIEQHKGRIEVTGNLNEGTTFMIFLPIK